MAAEYAPKNVLADLLYLRKGPGYTRDRLVARKGLVSVLGGAAEPVEVLEERLISAIWSLREGDAELLLDIYGLATETSGLMSLGQRRDRAGRTLGIKREAVADRDAAAVEKLLTHLLTGWYPKSPTGIRVPESHNGFVQHAVSVTTFVCDRKHLESRHHYRLFALFDGVEYLGWSSAEPTPPVVVGEDFTVRTVETAGGYLHQFWHKEPMQRGQTYDLAFRVVNPDPVNDPYWLHEESLAFHEPTRFASFEAVFLGDLPCVAWAFSGLTVLERPGAPARANELAMTGSTPAARTQLRDLYGGLYSGIAWEW